MDEKTTTETEDLQNTIASLKPLLTSGDIHKAAQILRQKYFLPGRIDQEIISLLKRHQPPAQKCAKCGAERPARWTGTIGENENFWSFPECQQCRRSMLQEQAEQKMISTLRDRGLDPRFENAQLSDFSEGVRKSLPEDRGAFITGPCGTGKTHLLSALLRSTSAHSAIVVGASGELVLRHPDAYPLMTSIHEILLDVRSTFGRDTRITEAEVIDDITSVPVLLLDDLGTEKPTEWALSTIYLVVDRRYRNQLQTYFSSNLSLSELSGHLGDRITSRIAGMTKVIKLTGKDRRLSPKP